MEKMTMIILAVLVFGIGFMFFLFIYAGTLGISTGFVKSWCFGYCAVKVTLNWGSPLGLPFGPSLPGGFCGC